VATVPLVAAGILLVSAPPAFADCSHSWSNKDPQYGYLVNDAHLRVGPHGHCTAGLYEFVGTKIYYHCYVVNEYGNTWTHGRPAGWSKGFWIWDENLDDNGSYQPC
jgi:hypothetical protein